MLVRTAEIRWFSSKREAEQYAKSKLGKAWKVWASIEPAGYHQKSGWNVKIFEPMREERNR